MRFRAIISEWQMVGMCYELRAASYGEFDSYVFISEF